MLSYQNKIKSSREGSGASSSSEAVVNFGGEEMIENNPVGESQANGMVEKAIQDVLSWSADFIKFSSSCLQIKFKNMGSRCQALSLEPVPAPRYGGVQRMTSFARP